MRKGFAEPISTSPRRRPKRSSRSPERADRLLELGLAAIVLVSVLAVGAVHLPVLLVVAAMALALGCWVLWTERNDRGRTLWPAWVLAGLSGYSLFQALPLPLAVLRRLSPRAAEVWANALPTRFEPLSWGSLSLDPGASVTESLKWLVYAAVIVAAARLGRHKAAVPGLRLVFLAAVIASLTTLAHGILGAERLFGVYEPRYAAPRWALAPLLNPNNFAGYLNLGAFCGVGLLISPRVRLSRPLLSLAVAMVIAVSAVLASRAGLAVLVGGLLLLVPLLVMMTRRPGYGAPRPPLMTVVAPVLIAAAAGLGLAVLGGGREKWNALLEEGATKLLLVQWTLPMIRDYPVFGAGRGAFGSVFPEYANPDGHRVFHHAENFVAQWVTEWGIPVTAVALGVLAWTCRPRRLRVHQSLSSAAAFMGILALLSQNLLDLALEVPAVAIALAVVLGTLDGAARRRAAREHERPSGDDSARARSELRLVPAATAPARRPALAIGLAVSGVGLMIGAAWMGSPSVLTDREASHDRLETANLLDPAQRIAFFDELGAAIRRHPADPYLPLIGGHAALRSRDKEAFRWIGRAIERAPKSARPYVLLSAALRAAGAEDQALHALSLAAEREPALAPKLAKVATSMTRDPERLLRAAPAGAPGASLLVALATRLSAPDEVLARAALLEQAATRAPAEPEPRARLARLLLDAIDAGHPLCDGAERAACRVRIDRHLRALAVLPVARDTWVVLKARLLGIDTSPHAAEAFLAEHCTSLKESVPCLEERLAAAKALELDTLTAAATDYVTHACEEPRTCSKALEHVGSVYAKRDLWREAAEHFRRAATVSAEPNLWMRTAEAANRAGDPARALHALKQAERLRQRRSRP